ncbi:GNAT family N-acetyltransferase [Hyphomonas neptunium]|nr:GNAT family N-acetyltransferase [Hyphomonas hirschiana]
MTPAHIAEAVRVQAQAFTEDLRESPEVFADRLSRFGEYYRVAFMEGRMVGYMIGFPWKLGETLVNNEKFPADLPAPDCFYIHDIAILPEARGAGISKAMLEDAYKTAHRLGFDAVSLVAVGQSGSYWDNAGYVPYTLVGPRKLERIVDIYGPGARLMALPI